MSRHRPDFFWEGINRKGESIQGWLRARDHSDVRAQLRTQGINPVRIRQRLRVRRPGARGAPAEDISLFLRQLGDMLAAGIPLTQALEMIARGQARAATRAVIQNIRNDVEKGSSLADALAAQPRDFGLLEVNLVAAGEKSGVLDSLLKRIALTRDKNRSLRARGRKAMIYPGAVLAIAVIVTTVLLVFVVPQFQDLFHGFGAELPVLTRWVIDLSGFLQDHMLHILLALIAVFVLMILAWRRLPGLRRWLDYRILDLPLLGPWQRRMGEATFSRTLGTLLGAGVPMVEGLRLLSGGIANIAYRELTLAISEEIMEGKQLHTGMALSRLFSPMAVQMVHIGEDTGMLEKMLERIADLNEQEVDDMVDNLAKLTEPAIMGFLGILVGGLVVSMYLPVFRMGAVM